MESTQKKSVRIGKSATIRGNAPLKPENVISNVPSFSVPDNVVLKKVDGRKVNEKSG